jgi:hypothetical protein
LTQLRILSEEAVITDRAAKAAQRSLEISTDQYHGGHRNYLLSSPPDSRLERA